MKSALHMHRGRVSSAFIGVSLALMTLACSGRRIVVNPRSFERPGDLAFICFDDASGEAVALQQCTGSTDNENAQFRLTAVLLQTSRGEIAAVDMQTNKIIDFDRRVPGFTFIAVGEVPIALAIPTNNPRKLYIAESGSRLLRALPSARLRPGRSAAEVGVDQLLALPDAPAALWLSPNERFLYVSLPQRASLAEVSLAEDGSFLAIRELPLAAPATLPPALNALPTPPRAFESYEKVCGASAALANPTQVPDSAPQVLAGDGQLRPEPSALAFDAERNLLLVADRRLPLLHVLALDAEGRLQGPARIAATGVPLQQLVVTPRLPSQIGTYDVAKIYVYAIDASDQSVLVLDASADDPATWNVLSTSATWPNNDRLALGQSGGVRTLSLMTPDFPNGVLCGEDTLDLASGAAPGRLRGVFLALGLGDGTIRVLDIHDLDAPCRGGTNCSGNIGNALDQRVFLRRHQLRIGDFVRTGVAVVTTPEMIFNGSPNRINADGSTQSLSAPQLGPPSSAQVGGLPGCPPTMTQIYPRVAESPDPLICTSADPWVAVEEQWTIAYEAKLPGASGGRGRKERDAGGGALEAGNWFAAPDADFCGRGSLGREDVPSNALESGYVGDQLVILSELPPQSRDLPECQLAAVDTFGRPKTLAFPVLRSYRDALLLGPLSLDGTATFEVAQRCFDAVLKYELRTQQAYTVVGSLSGDGRCAIDSTLPFDPAVPATYRHGRALPGRPFLNPYIAFQIQHKGDNPAAPLAAGANAQLRFSIGQSPDVLALDINAGQTGNSVRSVLPSLLRYSITDNRLYAIDESSRGLVQIDLSPFRFLRAFE